MIDYLLRMMQSWRPDPPEQVVIEMQEEARPERHAARRVLVQHRAVNFAYSTDGKMHLRRRARQIKRDFGRGFQWRAMPTTDRDKWAPPRHAIHPWWWI